MSKLSADEIAERLEEIGQRLELEGEAGFKVKAYHRAAESLRALPEPLEDIIARGELRSIQGVGPAIEEKIAALASTGTHRTLERLREQFPAGVLELLRVPRLGADKAAQLYRELGIAGLDDLEAACRAGRLAAVKGFGEKTQERLIQGVAFARMRGEASLIHHGAERMAAACARLTARHPEVEEAIPAGDLRRGCEVVIDQTIAARCTTLPTSVEDSGAWPVRFATDEAFGSALIWATGSKAHLDGLQELAASRGLELKPDGLFRAGARIPCADEDAVYSAFGLPFIEPELREGRGEIEAAREGRLPVLVTDADIRGVLHSHTNASDGTATLEEMAEAARSQGYEYFGVCDHSKTASYAGGLKEEQVRAQHELVERLNKGYSGTGFHIFKGIECDILTDGQLDYSDEVLASFDFVVASVHSRFSLDREAQTARIVRAVSNPFTTILGHMTGRLLLSRESYDVDVEAVLAACAEHGVVVEINADPHRLDLDWRWHRRAMELGCMLSIHPDAHGTGDIDLIKWGVKVARKGWVTKERVLVCMGLDQIAAYFGVRKQRAVQTV